MSNKNLSITQLDVLASLKQTRDNLRRQIEQIEGVIALYSKDADLLSEAVALSKNEAHEYSASWPLKSKVVYVFKVKNRFLHAREIGDFIFTKEGLGEPTESIRGQISQALNNLKTDGVLVNIKVNNQNVNTFWGSKDWLQPDGEIRIEHAYDQSQLSIRTLLNL